MANIEIRESANAFDIEFPYNPRIVQTIKSTIPGAWYEGATKIWKAPMRSKPQVHLFASRFKININAGSGGPEMTGDIAPLPDINFDIDAMVWSRSRKAKGENYLLREYQKKGIGRQLEYKRLIVGDEPGLGKTAQAIATIEVARAFPALILCPSTLKINWQREIADWTGRKSIILNDSCKNNFQKYYDAGLADYFIVNFESLKKYFVESISVPKGHNLLLKHVNFKQNINMFKSVIIDESHRCKSSSAQQSKFTKGICIGKEYVIAMTGTPVVNRPVDLINQLRIIDRLDSVFGGARKFMSRYCSGMKQASNLNELKYHLYKHCFYRREKKEVLKDLPAKMRQVVLCEIATRKEYNDALNDLKKYLIDYKQATDAQIQKSMRGEIMVRIGILKNISARGKMNDVFDFVDDLMESGEKLVLFIHLKEIAEKVLANYPDAVSVTGKDNQQQRQAAVDSFQNNPNVKLIVCSIQAAGVGITLTAASRVAFVELGWHPAIHDQCEDRCHRMGQTDSVQCTYFLGRETIDEWVYKIIDEKRNITNTITGTSDDVEVDVIDNIVNLFNQPK